MTIVRVQGNARGTSASQNTISVTLASAPTEGNVLVATIGTMTSGGVNVYDIDQEGVDWTFQKRGSLYQNYNKTRYFREIFPILEEAYSQEWHFLAEFNMHIIRKICAVLGIEVKFVLSSEIDEENHNKTDRLIFLTKTVGGDTYLSGQGGRKYIQREQFRNHNLDLLFMVFSPVHYTQQFGDFVPNLSIVDLLFNVGLKARAVIEKSSEVES